MPTVAALSIERMTPDEIQQLSAYELGAALNEIAAAEIILTRYLKSATLRLATAQKDLLLCGKTDPAYVDLKSKEIDAKTELAIIKATTQSRRKIASYFQSQLRSTPV